MVVAMSGGVDSSVTAAMLVDQGYNVTGITMQLFDDASPASWNDARRVCDIIGIPHQLEHFEKEFSKIVMEDFADSYLNGRTPVPCVVCNKHIKFGELMSAAKKIGADALATGHYVRRIMGKNGPELHKATDDTRDQSYFLFAISKEQLDFIRFPLGEMSKTETRRLAEEKYHLPIANRPDSQDICFVPGGDYAGLVARMRPKSIKPGNIVDMEGNVLGKHEGIIHFTIGQRRGLNISDRKGDNNDPLYVVGMDAKDNRIIVGPYEALAHNEVTLTEVNWLGEDFSEDFIEVTARLRSPQKPLPARFSFLPDRRGILKMAAPVHGIAPGQAGVIYDGPRLLGGGWIT